MAHRTPAQSSLVRSFTFGVEDSLASTVGLLSGVASASVNTSTIVLTGIVLVFTEAMSMGVGTFLTEQSVEEYEHHRDLPLKRSLPSAIVMFLSYLLSGVIPITPYALLPMPLSLYISILAAFISLVLLGFFNAFISHTPYPRSVWRMAVLGGSVAIAGVVAGRLLKNFLGYAI